MFCILIVDDETAVRSSLSSILDWENEGFRIAGTASNGQAALKLMQAQNIDVLFTDIKMPLMDGLELIRRVNELPKRPAVIVLSAYSEFDLVRQAFKLGAYDYVLKNDITQAYITELLRTIRPYLHKKGCEEPRSDKPDRQEQFRRMVMGDMRESTALLPAKWCLACLEIDNFKKESIRFGEDLKSSLTQPMLEFAQQVPRIAAKCIVTPVSFSRFIILFTTDDAIRQAHSICQQVQRVWKDYMNLSITGGISRIGELPEDFPGRLQESYDNMTLKFIFGAGGIFTSQEQALFDVKSAQNCLIQLQPLLEGLRNVKTTQQLLVLQQPLIAKMYRGTLEEARIMALEVIYNFQLQLLDAGDDMWNVFNTAYGTDFYQKIRSLLSIRDVELMLGGVIHWIHEYLYNTQLETKTDVIEKAKDFIAKHYTDPELHLSAVADYVGLSEKYFSSRFNKETGQSFVNYLTALRIAHAKQLILKTDMKMYEISEAAGFTSVEHFTRVFKKVEQISPKKFRG